MLPLFISLDWPMIKLFFAFVLYFMCIGWMTKLLGSQFMGILFASILIYIAWENEFLIYFIFSLYFFNAFLGQIYNAVHVPLKGKK